MNESVCCLTRTPSRITSCRPHRHRLPLFRWWRYCINNCSGSGQRRSCSTQLKREQEHVFAGELQHGLQDHIGLPCHQDEVPTARSLRPREPVFDCALAGPCPAHDRLGGAPRGAHICPQRARNCFCVADRAQRKNFALLVQLFSLRTELCCPRGGGRISKPAIADGH